MSAHPSALDVDVLRVGRDHPSAVRDFAAAEEPLELRLGGQPFVTIMRTPGADRELAAGFLLAERIVASGGEIAAMRYCRDDDGRDAANVMSVWLQGDAVPRAQRALGARRHVVTSAACGVCGRRSIDDLLADVGPVGAALTVSRAVIERMPDRLRAAQRTFDQTGGLHAAGLFDAAGTLHGAAEDVGRHNAVDKVIGEALLTGSLPLSGRLLFVSGRTSFEIVQKAVVAGIPIVASVSAPSSLAIELARNSGLTLAGFVRGHGFNIYTGQERIQL